MSVVFPEIFDEEAPDLHGGRDRYGASTAPERGEGGTEASGL